jgi:hypothetical protein
LAKAGERSASFGSASQSVFPEARSKRTSVLFLLPSGRKFDIVKQDLRGLVRRSRRMRDASNYRSRTEYVRVTANRRRVSARAFV